jgi:hypothetical protein
MSLSDLPSVRFLFPMAIFLFFGSCMSEKPKPPLFTTKINAVVSSIKKITPFENITFEGSENTYNKKTFSAISVTIDDPPMSNNFQISHQEDSLLRDVGKRIVLDIQKHLKDPAEYQYYSIDFIRHYGDKTKMTRYYNYEINNLEEMYPIVRQFQ